MQTDRLGMHCRLKTIATPPLVPYTAGRNFSLIVVGRTKAPPSHYWARILYLAEPDCSGDECRGHGAEDGLMLGSPLARSQGIIVGEADGPHAWLITELC
jgi:hypothetical protein